MLGGIEEVGSDHGVAVNPLKLDAVPFQDDPFVFDILSDLLHLASSRIGFNCSRTQERGSCLMPPDG